MQMFASSVYSFPIEVNNGSRGLHIGNEQLDVENGIDLMFKYDNAYTGLNNM